MRCQSVKPSALVTASVHSSLYFETTLRGFRLQPFASSWGMAKGGLDSFVSSRIKLEDLLQKPNVIERAHEFGLAATPEELHAKISSAAKALSYYTGPYHGDLHTGNVMVRGGDAILIDFGSRGHGPLTADPATLEASLMFGTESWETEAVFTEWRVSIRTNMMARRLRRCIHRRFLKRSQAVFRGSAGPYVSFVTFCWRAKEAEKKQGLYLRAI